MANQIQHQSSDSGHLQSDNDTEYQIGASVFHTKPFFPPLGSRKGSQAICLHRILFSLLCSQTLFSEVHNRKVTPIKGKVFALQVKTLTPVLR